MVCSIYIFILHRDASPAPAMISLASGRATATPGSSLICRQFRDILTISQGEIIREPSSYDGRRDRWACAKSQAANFRCPAKSSPVQWPLSY